MKPIERIADFLGVTTEYLLTGVETKKAPALTEKDKRDVAKEVYKIMDSLESSGELKYNILLGGTRAVSAHPKEDRQVYAGTRWFLPPYVRALSQLIWQKVSSNYGSPRALFEQQNQKLCYEVLKEKLAAREPISVELIQEIHRVLTSGTYDERRYIDRGERPGEFKKHDYVTGIHEVGSSPEAVEPDLRELIAEVNEIGQKNPLKAGAYLHAQFEYIHPFADGNGRVGRALLNYWLMVNDYPPMIIYEEDKREYYLALQAYDEEENLDALTDLFKKQTVKTWERAMNLAQAPKQERRGLADLLDPSSKSSNR